MGEHDCWSKTSLWEGSVRVPLIISVPGNGKRNGSTSETITELIDLYPTLTELSGLAGQEPDILQGKSLVDHLRGNKHDKKNAFAYTVSYGGKAGSLRSDRWRYTRWGDKKDILNEELYDHENDPEESVNLSRMDAYKVVLNEMRKKFEQYRGQVALINCKEL